MIFLLNNFKKTIEKQSSLIKNYALISFTAGIGLYVYSLLISYYNPKAIVTRLTLDYNMNCNQLIGEYMQLHEYKTQKNYITKRAIVCIYLCPS